MALMTSFIALSIDIMLPALAIIGDDLGALRDNDRQLIIGVLFLGMATQGQWRRRSKSAPGDVASVLELEQMLGQLSYKRDAHQMSSESRSRTR